MSKYQEVNAAKKDKKPITITANAVERIRHLLNRMILNMHMIFVL